MSPLPSWCRGSRSRRSTAAATRRPRGSRTGRTCSRTQRGTARTCCCSAPEARWPCASRRTSGSAPRACGPASSACRRGSCSVRRRRCRSCKRSSASPWSTWSRPPERSSSAKAWARMPRDLPLSNGRLLVAFGRDYLIRDIYYPHVGKENHATGHPFRFGVWTEGKFSWIGSDWQLDRRYAVDSMVTEVRARHEVLGIELLFHDAVDFYENVLVRHIGVTNLQDRAREIRLFFHHDFHIRGNEVGDTALYSPETQALIHYKDDRYFLINCAVGGEVGVRRYACGKKEIAGTEGTWRDAEDGELQGNPIAQGSVDSTLGLSVTVPARGSVEADYWMAAGRDFREVATWSPSR